MPSNEQFEKRMRKLQVSKDDLVVCYEKEGFIYAAMAWFLLKAFGHQHVAVLDGGLQEWKKAGYPLESKKAKLDESDSDSEQEKDYDYKPNSKYLCSYEEICQISSTKSAQIIDTRFEAAFNGYTKGYSPGIQGGRIPGAVNIYYRNFFDERGMIKPEQHVLDILNSKGINTTAPTVVYGKAGISVCSAILALKKVGVSARLYNGSWSEYGYEKGRKSKR